MPLWPGASRRGVVDDTSAACPTVRPVGQHAAVSAGGLLGDLEGVQRHRRTCDLRLDPHNYAEDVTGGFVEALSTWPGHGLVIRDRWSGVRFVVGCKIVAMFEAVHPWGRGKMPRWFLSVVPCGCEWARRSSIVAEDCIHYAA